MRYDELYDRACIQAKNEIATIAALQKLFGEYTVSIMERRIDAATQLERENKALELQERMQQLQFDLSSKLACYYVLDESTHRHALSIVARALTEFGKNRHSGRMRALLAKVHAFRAKHLGESITVTAQNNMHDGKADERR